MDMEQMQIRKNRPGPKPDPTKAMIREMFRDWSPRRFETYWSGHKLLLALEHEGYVDREGRIALAQEINDRIVRPNGTFSVARYERECANAYLKVTKAYDSEHAEGPGGGTGALASSPPSVGTTLLEEQS
jgi:hypothetical protein